MWLPKNKNVPGETRAYSLITNTLELHLSVHSKSRNLEAEALCLDQWFSKCVPHTQVGCLPS